MLKTSYWCLLSNVQAQHESKTRNRAPYIAFGGRSLNVSDRLRVVWISDPHPKISTHHRRPTIRRPDGHKKNHTSTFPSSYTESRNVVCTLVRPGATGVRERSLTMFTAMSDCFQPRCRRYFAPSLPSGRRNRMTGMGTTPDVDLPQSSFSPPVARECKTHRRRWHDFQSREM